MTKDLSVFVSTEIDGVIISVFVVSSTDEPIVLSIRMVSVIVVREFVVV